MSDKDERLILTIGVYGFTAETFFAKLVESRVDMLCDVRSRRGVRGSEYAFANSARLQERLQELGIGYAHAKSLAPSIETRRAQYAADAAHGIGKRSREELGPEFEAAYRREALARFDADRFLTEFARDAKRPALLCVERSPAACHRSLLAEEIGRQTGLKVEHLTP